jgi:hypothetical protein
MLAQKEEGVAGVAGGDLSSAASAARAVAPASITATMLVAVVLLMPSLPR